MLAVYASALIIFGASLAVGRALLHALGSRETTWLEPAAGFALLAVVGSLSARLLDSGAASAVALGVLTAASLVYLRGRVLPGADWRLAAGPALIAAALASLPLLASLRVGVLGVGVNNDLASHLLWADWLIDQSDPQPVGLARGYPVGPHSIAASLGETFGFGITEALIGLLIAVAAMTALTALALFRDLPTGRRLIACSLVALPYLTASALAVGGFKETVMSMLLLAFVLGLARLERDYPGDLATGVSLGVIAAGSLAVYSYPGLYWLIAASGLLALAGLLRARRGGGLGQAIRGAAKVVAIPLAVLVVLGAAELDRANTFRKVGDVGSVVETDSKLRHAVSPLEGLGAWPDGDFLTGTSGLGAWPLFGALGVIALLLALAWWVRRRELAVPLAVLGAVVIYLATLASAGLYVQSKALAVPAPLVMLLIARALLEPLRAAAEARSRRSAGESREASGRWAPARQVVMVAFVAVAALSSFLALRDAVVAPNDHADELTGIRDRVQGDWTLSLTTDRYTDYELRSAKVVSPARNVHIIVPSRKGKDFRLPLDFDSVDPETLDVVNWVLVTGARYRSEPPPNLRLVESTDSYQLYKRVGPTPLNVRVFGEEARPGKVLECKRPGGPPRGYRLRPRASVIDPAPAIGKRFAWEPSNELGPGDSVSQELKLPPGTWDLSLQYQSPVVGLTIEASGQEFELPAAMDGAIPFRLGEGPFWPVGRIEVAQGPVEITVRADDLSAIQSLLGVNRRAAIGNIVATAPDPYRVIPFTDACGAYVDHFEVADSVALRDPGAITHRRKIARAALQGRYDPRNLPDE